MRTTSRPDAQSHQLHVCRPQRRLLCRGNAPPMEQLGLLRAATTKHLPCSLLSLCSYLWLQSGRAHNVTIREHQETRRIYPTIESGVSLEHSTPHMTVVLTCGCISNHPLIRFDWIDRFYLVSNPQLQETDRRDSSAWQRRASRCGCGRARRPRSPPAASSPARPSPAVTLPTFLYAHPSISGVPASVYPCRPSWPTRRSRAVRRRL